MDDRGCTNKEAIFKDVTDNGKTITIVVNPVEEGLWELSIQGKGNQLTTWTDWFSSSEEAMSEGMSAVLQEGTEEFYSNPDFDYML